MLLRASSWASFAVRFHGRRGCSRTPSTSPSRPGGCSPFCSGRTLPPSPSAVPLGGLLTVVFRPQLVPVPLPLIAATSAVRLESVAESTQRITLCPSVHDKITWFVWVGSTPAAVAAGNAQTNPKPSASASNRGLKNRSIHYLRNIMTSVQLKRSNDLGSPQGKSEEAGVPQTSFRLPTPKLASPHCPPAGHVSLLITSTRRFVTRLTVQSKASGL